MSGLTEKQAAVLRFIESHTASAGWPPTHREICAEFGYASPNAANVMLKALERKGYVAIDRNKARCIQVLRATV